MLLRNPSTQPKTSAIPSECSDNPRFAMFRLTENAPRSIHRTVQSFLDWLTGYYLTPPLWKSSPILELLYGVIQYGGGLGLVSVAFSKGQFWLIPVGSWLSVAGAAQLQEVTHFCAHNAFFIHSKLNNNRLGWLLTLLTGKKPFPLFKQTHLFVHHPPLNLATMADQGNTPYLVNDLGFKFGEDLDFYPQQLKKVLLSPSFYWNTFKSRLLYLLNAPTSYRLAVITVLLLSGLLMSLTHTWCIGLVWLILTQLGSYAAALLQQLPEHNWGYQPEANEGAKSQVIHKSFAVYLGSYPPCSKELGSWLKWLGEIPLNIIIRLTFLPVTLPSHCLHHALPNDKDWANQLVRLRTFQQGQIKGWKADKFPEIWGFSQALNYVFKGFSQTNKHH